MSNLTPLQHGLLDLGLEDWIPLPETSEAPEVRESIDGTASVDVVSKALVELLRLGLIQVWKGRWSDEPRPVGLQEAEELLRDSRRYSFDAEAAAGLDRVYYVNVENVRS
jgi:hypothetical protein